MPKKSKVGKQRKDKFYHLAKDAGYRSRAAFKLVQLNRKFEFLQRARVLVDLCAAPGGWLQIAQQNMPVSSVIIGVDLVPIKPIPNVITIQEDITTGKCRSAIKKHLKTWKADVVLNDGAPNVGKSWDHDAFAQAQLTLHAMKLATEILMKGGWFVTKVFRSKDYNALLWVFNKLFKKVHATKPQASRHESAEIFVVCQHYLAPDKIDPKFLDPAHVFKDVEPETKKKLNLFKPDGKVKKAKAEGYADGDLTLVHKVPASEFIHSNNHLEILANCTEIFIDDDKILKHPLTKNEIKECLSDIKVLGKSELKDLLAWRKKLKQYFDKLNSGKKAVKEDGEAQDEEKLETPKEINEIAVDNEDEDDDARLKAELKRKKKKILKDKRKLQAKTELKMIIKDDEPIAQEDAELFQLEQIRKRNDLNLVTEQDASVIPGEDEDESDDDDDIHPSRKRKITSYDRDDKSLEWNQYNTKLSESEDDSMDETGSIQLSESDHEDEDDEGSDADDDGEVELSTRDVNPLVVDLADEPDTHSKRAKIWFDKETFGDLESDEDIELDLMAENEQNKNEKMEENRKNGTDETKDEESGASDEDDSDSDDDTSSSDEDEKPEIPRKKRKKIKLDPQGMALGTLMVRSKKAKRDIIDAAYNRYAFNDENLPDWFTQDEAKHNRPNIPVSAEMVAEYKARLKEINARPIKKVAEAKGRKRKRELKKLERARKKAEAVTESMDMSAHEKAQHIKTIYKKALAEKKDKNVTYVFPKKGIGKKVRRPPGVKGKFKVVDKRMKKDDRVKKAQTKGKKSVRRRKRMGR